MKDMRRKCNVKMDLSKFTSNKKILSGVGTMFGAKLCPFTTFKPKPTCVWAKLACYNNQINSSLGPSNPKVRLNLVSWPVFNPLKGPINGIDKSHE